MTASWIAAGFWWWDGFNATRHWHDVGASPDRPYGYFFVADLVVLAVMATCQDGLAYVCAVELPNSNAIAGSSPTTQASWPGSMT